MNITRHMANPIDEMLQHGSTLPHPAYAAMWTMLDELDSHRVLLGLSPYGDNAITKLRQQGHAAWLQAIYQTQAAASGSDMRDRHYTRLSSLCAVFSLLHEESGKSEHPLSTRFRLAQGMTVLAELLEQSSVAHATQAQPFRTECFTPLFTNVASDPFGSHHGQDSPRPLPAVQTNSLFSDSDSVVELGARATRQLTIGRERAHRLEAPPTSVLASGADKWGISDGPAVFRLYKSPEPSIIPGVEKETSLICEPVAIEYRISAASHDKDCDSDDIRGLGIPRSDGSSPPPNTRRSSIQDEFPPLDIFDFCSFPDRSKLQRPSAPEVESDIASAQEDLDGMSSCAGDDERSSSTCSSDNSEVPPLRFRQSTQDRARAVRAGSVTGGLPTCGNVGDRGSAA